jgi:divalent metal cation (Fe/Co/Zn/Cd) transporter
MHDVLDGTVEQASIDSVYKLASDIPSVDTVEVVKIRKSGIGWYVDMHVWVSPQMTIVEGHALSHKIKGAIMDANKLVYDVMIHLEPTKPKKD